MRTTFTRGVALLAGALVTLGVSAPEGAPHHKFSPRRQAVQQTQQQSRDAFGDLRKEIEMRDIALCEAIRKGDPAAIARFYDEDAQIKGPQTRVTGRSAIEQYWASMEGIMQFKLEVQEVGGAKDSAWESGRTHLVREIDGRKRSGVVDFVKIWNRDSKGELRVHVEMYNYAN
ncbi:MAG: nuclear transport factor 2 family protein [Gemmatimonadota bacterium]|nr:nuclear transport factor 2 family protein [Gemmatimonadota bacterium]